MFLEGARARTWTTEGESSRKRFKRSPESNLQVGYLNEYEQGVLLKIFADLTFETLFSAGLTCKSWHSLSYNKELLRLLASKNLDATYSSPNKKTALMTTLAIRLLSGSIEPRDELLAINQLMYAAAREIIMKPPSSLKPREKFVLGHALFRQDFQTDGTLTLIREGQPEFLKNWLDNAFAEYSRAAATFPGFHTRVFTNQGVKTVLKGEEEKESLALFEKAAEKNLISAQFAQFTLLPGREVEETPDDKAVVDLLNRAAEAGSAEALFHLCRYIEDPEEQEKVILRSAEGGYEWAQLYFFLLKMRERQFDAFAFQFLLGENSLSDLPILVIIEGRFIKARAKIRT